MHYSVGDKVLVRINKIQNNGCFCSFLNSDKFGFLPNHLMPCFFDGDGHFLHSLHDSLQVIIYNISSNGGFILSDELSYYKKQEKDEKRRVSKEQIQSFASEYEVGTIFEAEVIRVQNTKVSIRVGSVDGIITKEETNWNEVDQLKQVFFVGEIINAVYLKCEKGKLYFSLKLLNEKPYDDKLYNLSLRELLKYIGHDSEDFIGVARQYHYGLFVENLYSADENQKGKLLIDPIYGYNLRALVPNANFGVEEGHYYRVSLKLGKKERRLERNQLFQFIAVNIEAADNPYKADVNMAFQRNTTNPAANQRDAKLLNEIGKDMYSSKDRMFFELIQNADDAASKNGVLVNVKTEDDYLMLKHNGYSFDKDDFISITTAANGTKKANENKTGYKGIGFKSVFTDSELVFISTGGYKFKFDKNEPLFQHFDEFYLENNPMIINAETRSRFLELYSDYKKQFDGIRSIPWQLEPIWVDSFPEELGGDFEDSNVAIALKLGKNNIYGDYGYNQAIDEIISNPKFMLFLRNTKRIDVNGKSVSKETKQGIITLKNSFGSNRVEYFKREDFAIAINNDVFESNGINIRIRIEEQDDATGKIIEAKLVDLQNQELENIPKKIAINNSTTISFAVPLTEDGHILPNQECSEISMFSFLPTLVKDFKFPFYINANFVLDSSRERIHGESPWNFYLMQQIARLLVCWCASLSDKHEGNALNVLLPNYFDEEYSDTKQLARYFNQEYKTSLKSKAFILNHKGFLSKQNEIMIDRTGLSEVIGSDLLCKILETEKLFPSTIIDSSILTKEIFDEIEALKFDEVIKAVTNNQSFNEWFTSANEDKKELIYEWIKEKDTPNRHELLKQFVADLPLLSFGKENKSFNEIGSSNYIISTEQVVPIKMIMEKLGYKCSSITINENYPLFDFLEPQNEDILFQLINGSDFSCLNFDERRALLIALKNTKNDVERIKKLSLFKNINGVFKPLNEMVEYRENVHPWLYDYAICKEEYDSELSNYLIKEEDEFKEIIQKHYHEINAPLIELYNAYKDNYWTGQFTRSLIPHWGNDIDEITIIEESDNQTKVCYLDSINKIEFKSGEYYDKNSFFSRLLQLAINTLEVPSDYSSRIYFEGQCISNFSVKDEVICKYIENGVNKEVKMSLAKLLPQYRNLSEGIDKFKSLFEKKEGLNKFFDATPMPLGQIIKKLENRESLNLKPGQWPTDRNGNAYQYLFYVFYYRNKNYASNYVISIDLTKEKEEFIHDMMDFLYENNLDIRKSPFTFRVYNYFIDKSFDNDYIFESEMLLPQIEQWAKDDNKRCYLLQNGVKDITSYAIKFRKSFLENVTIDFLEKISDDDLKKSILWIANNDEALPFSGENQLKVLHDIKERYKVEDGKYNVIGTFYDIDNLKSKAKELATNKYKIWRRTASIKIAIYPGKLPRRIFYKLSYNNIVNLAYYEDTDYFFYINNNTLYVNGTSPFDEVLYDVVKDKKINSFGLDDYDILCRYGKKLVAEEEIVAKDERIKDLQKENDEITSLLAKYKAKYGELNTDDTSNTIKDVGFDSPLGAINNIGSSTKGETIGGTISKGEDDVLSKKEKFQAQIEAQKALMEKMPSWDYPKGYGEFKEDGTPYHFSTVKVKEQQGNPIYIVLKSYKKQDEPFKINPEEWSYIIKENAHLFIYNGDDILELAPKDLIMNQRNITITFSTENLDIEERIDAFANALHYFKDLHFDFESFNVSNRAKSIREIYNITTGKQNQSSDDDL